jgi:hypothetical protein
VAESRNAIEKVLVKLEELRADSWRNNRETARINRAIEQLKAKISSTERAETSATPKSDIKKPNEAA